MDRRRGRAVRASFTLAIGPVVGLVLATVAGCTPAGCTPDRPLAAGDRTIAIDADAVWATIRDAQADRLDALAVFSSAGDATIRFTDPRGDRRTEQVDLRLWRVAPSQAAVRLSKVGSSFLLAGWNGDRWWLLDESGDPPVLQIRRFDPTEGEAEGAAAGATGRTPGAADGAAGLLSPPTFLAMLGLLPWPESPPPSLRAFDANEDGEADTFTFELDRLVVVVARPADGPVRIDLLDEADRPILTSRLERPEPVETLGRPPGAWPSLSHRMRVTRPGGDEIVVRLDGPIAGGEVSPRLFDLDTIRRRAANAIVEDATAVEPSGEEVVP